MFTGLDGHTKIVKPDTGRGTPDRKLLRDIPVLALGLKTYFSKIHNETRRPPQGNSYYLLADGNWVTDGRFAQDFDNTEAALCAIQKLQARDLELVLMMGEKPLIWMWPSDWRSFKRLCNSFPKRKCTIEPAS